MKSVLSELYYGRIYPLEQIVPNDPKYPTLSVRIDTEFDSLKKKLGEEDSIQLDHLHSNLCELSGMSSRAAFSHGLRLGVMLMSDVFSGENK